MGLGSFTAHEDLDEETKKKCEELIEKGMGYCSECEVDSIDQIEDACLKHKRMYGTIRK